MVQKFGMKKILFIFVFIFSFSALKVWSAVGDVYYCETTKNVEIHPDDIIEFQKYTFKFKRKVNLIEFLGGGYFGTGNLPVDESLGEFFYGADRWHLFVFTNDKFVYNFSLNDESEYFISAILATCEIL